MLGRITELCRERKISVLELERRAGLKQRTVYRWDDSIPAVDKVKAVADVLGTTVDDLLREGDVTNDMDVCKVGELDGRIDNE